MHAAFGEVVLFYCLMSKVKKQKKGEREKTFPAVSNMHMVATAPQPMGIYLGERQVIFEITREHVFFGEKQWAIGSFVMLDVFWG